MLNSWPTFGEETDLGSPLIGETLSGPVLAGAAKNGSSISSRLRGLSVGSPLGECRAAIVL